MRALGLATVGAAVVNAAPASADIVSSGEVNLPAACEDEISPVVDLDGDGTDDFNFPAFKCCVWLSGAITAMWVIDESGSAQRLFAGELINNSLPFSPPGSSATLSHPSDGNWSEPYPVTGYIGVGLMIDSEVHYGWIEYEAQNSCDGRVVQWAYDDIPGVPIEAGATENCPGDLDDDGMVGVTDFLGVLAAWGPCPGCPEDLDFDGVVGIQDFLQILSLWGPCP
jgi:hypothetical protein